MIAAAAAATAADASPKIVRIFIPLLAVCSAHVYAAPHKGI
jgi:hypothetical protein